MLVVNGWPPFPVLVLLLVVLLITTRRLGRLRLPVWQLVAGGALLTLLGGSISTPRALQAIDWDVMGFLFGTFVLGGALVDSGYLYALAHRLLARAATTQVLVFWLVGGAGLGSAVLMNDTLAIMGTPLMLRMAAAHRLPTRPLLLGLCFAVTTGGVMSPIGNPQNLLVAAQLDAPFRAFLGYLGPPTLLALLLVYLAVRLAYRADFHAVPLVHPSVPLRDVALASRARLGLWLVLLMVLVKVVWLALLPDWPLPFAAIALAGALPVLAYRPGRRQRLRRLDWGTLVFFVGLFVLLAAVWDSGYVQRQLVGADPAAPGAVAAAGLLGSQLISNVPLVALYLPLLELAAADPATYLLLAATATLAGNLTLLGAASNIIVLQAAERRGETFGQWEFMRLGVPLTLAQLAVYAAWFRIFM